MNEKKSSGMNIGLRRAVSYIVLIILSFLCLFWFYVLFINATRSNSELVKGFTAIPSTHLMQNLHNVLHGTLPMMSGMKNSLIISALTALLCTYFSVMTAYAIQAYNFTGKTAIFTFILMIMMIPTQVTALGFVQLMNKMGLENSFIPLILPAIASPVTFFYMKQYMESNLPMSLLEAARIDGAGEFYIFNGIVLPLMKPAMATQAIFAFIASWNNLYVPSMMLVSSSKKTLPMFIQSLRSEQFRSDYGVIYMGLFLTVMPLLVVYFALSKYIIAGVALGGVKE